MTKDLPVICLMDRYWSPSEMDYTGVEKKGTLLDISTQSAEDDVQKLIPVGIVLLEDNTMASVPMAFIKKAETNA